MNEILLICILILSLIIVYITNKYLKKLGLIVLLTVSNLLSYILTFKYISIPPLNFNANVIPYITTFTSIYLLLEKNSKKEVNKIISFNFIITIFSGFMLYIMSSYTQSLTDTVGINMTNVFINNSRILITYPVSIFISQKILILIYEKIKELYDNFFISTVTTYLAVGLIECVLFTFLSYYKILNYQTIIQLILSTYMIRLIITIIYSFLLIKIDINKKVKQ